jgi:hypothetical protein
MSTAGRAYADAGAAKSAISPTTTKMSVLEALMQARKRCLSFCFLPCIFSLPCSKSRTVCVCRISLSNTSTAPASAPPRPRNWISPRRSSR